MLTFEVYATREVKGTFVTMMQNYRLAIVKASDSQEALRKVKGGAYAVLVF